MNRQSVCVGVILVLVACIHPAAGKERTAVRVTAIQMGTNIYVHSMTSDLIAPIATFPLAIPTAEAMIPLGPGALLVGTGFHQSSFTSKDWDDDELEMSFTGWTLGLGYAYKLLAAQNSAVRIGGRAGMAIFARVDTEFTSEDESSTDTDKMDYCFQTSVFVSGEYFPARHFGLAVESGLSVVGFAAGYVTENMVNIYGAFSGLIRF